MKPVDVTTDSYAEYNEDSNEKYPKLKVGDHVRISKYEKNFAKGFTQDWSEDVFVFTKIKDTVLWTYVISDLSSEKITSFYQKNYKNLVKKNAEQKKCLKEKVINCMSNGKDMMIHIKAGLMKKTLYKNESILS